MNRYWTSWGSLNYWVAIKYYRRVTLLVSQKYWPWQDLNLHSQIRELVLYQFSHMVSVGKSLKKLKYSSNITIPCNHSNYDLKKWQDCSHKIWKMSTFSSFNLDRLKFIREVILKSTSNLMIKTKKSLSILISILCIYIISLL